MREAVNSHALPVYEKNRIASLLCIFKTIIYQLFRVTSCSCLHLLFIQLSAIKTRQVSIVNTHKVYINGCYNCTGPAGLYLTVTPIQQSRW